MDWFVAKILLQKTMPLLLKGKSVFKFRGYFKSVLKMREIQKVFRMREAGAIHLAVTNTSEVCMWWESVNANYGRSRNAYDSRRLVGGSSGGEGALISAGGSLVGIGSDIGGSIRMPAFFNGVFGLKPTPGRF
jgi:fatty acid amide hydrolase 2